MLLRILLLNKPYAQRDLVEMPPLADYPSITALADDTGRLLALLARESRNEARRHARCEQLVVTDR